MSYTQRFYSGEADYAAMRGLIADCYRLVGPHAYMLLGDLDWWRACTDDPDTFLPTLPLWFAGDTLVGFLWPRPGRSDIMLHPHHWAAGPLMLAYAEQHFREPAKDGNPAALVQISLQSDTPRNQLLEQHGFQRTDDFLAWHEFALDQPPPEPLLPQGFAFSNMAIEQDVEARLQAHRAAFHPSRLTLPMYLRARQMPTYRPELDLVIKAPNGDFAAYTIVWFDTENRVGLFEPVGCHPDYQRRGLGRAVLYEGLRRLYERGATRAHVASWRGDSAGALLYRAAGFQLIDRWYDWHKSYPTENAEAP